MAEVTFDVVEIDEQPTIVYRTTATPSTVGQAFGAAMEPLQAHMQVTGAEMAGPPFIRYLSWGDEVDLEIGAPVREPVEDGDEVKSGKLPGGRAAHARHVGPYEQLGATYDAMTDWMEQESLEPTSGPWDSYTTDPDEVDDPEDYITDIFWPVA